MPMQTAHKLMDFCRRALAMGFASLALVGLSTPCLAGTAPVEPAGHVTAGSTPHCPPANGGGQVPGAAACATTCLPPLPEPSIITGAARNSPVALCPLAEPAMQGLLPELDEPPPR